MSLDIAHLRRAIALALDTAAPSAEEAEALGDLLGVREEVLAHLVLKRGAFAASPRIRAALTAAAAKAVAHTRTDVQTGRADPARIARQDRALTRSLKAVIELQAREAATLLDAEKALRERVLASPPAAYDAHLRIRLTDQS